ncbi:MAG: transposase [Actinobacteria bacterium]|nr:MAG: transposase [Actinomycetota bacterium]
MPRKPRISYSEAFFHITTRGNNRRMVYCDDVDRAAFLRMLERIARRFHWLLYAYCLMGTHYHVVLHLPDDGLSVGMCELNGGFARWSNFRHGWEDHLFGRRFSSIEIVRDEHLREACRYVVLNPVRAGLVDHPGDWPWSSYRATVGEELVPPYLAVGAVLAMFGNEPRHAIAEYRAYVEAGLVLPTPGLVPGGVPEM